MNEIKRLCEDVANKVAAGEVVERPYNVVKELMENSADAGADSLSVVVENGGAGYISVTDNGKGIVPDDLPLAVERFATSKISTVEDVYRVSTFGFRGEALAAISSVSDFSIRSFRKGYIGAELRIKYGEKSDILPAPMQEGTRVEVKSLFANVPARLKFFKNYQTEEKEIARFVRQFSVINPHVSVELDINGKRVYSADKSEDMLKRAKKVFQETEVVYGENEFEDMNVKAAVTLPSVHKFRKDMIIIGINGRVVKDLSLVQAVITAYHRLIPDGKFPAAAISLHMDPEKVDVNVHPAKTVVKLLDSREIFSFVHNTVKKILEEAGRETGEQMRAPEPVYKPVTVYESKYNEKNYSKDTVRSFDMAKELETVQYSARAEDAVKIPDVPEEERVRVVGQLFNTVIVCEKGDEAFFIDQHVAHERVLYEKYLEEKTVSVPSIVLYEPILIDVTEDEADIIEKGSEVLSAFGYDIEPFGGNSLKVSRVPSDVLNRDISKEIREILADMIENRKDSSVDYRVIVMSCKNAVKAGDKLEMHEMRKIVDDLFHTSNPYTCPHGRPIVFKMDRAWLFRKFDR
ncbi:MAG: DNA mismatch repair endonuclease MutL [Deferribacterales bacterium]